MTTVQPAVGQPGDETALVQALRGGDEAAFAALLDRHHTAMVRLAIVYVHDRAVAEEVAQETWLGVLQGLGQFEARSSLKTWIFHILVNRAKTRAARESRQIPFSAVWNPELEPSEPAVPPERFLPADHPQWPFHWAAPPRSWGDSPEERLIARETLGRIREAIATLPPSQREVITLRDIEGWTSEEVCNFLGVTETNQRVLLHRARSRVRRTLEQYLDDH
jgi:RNA polymerase sigma-70 factor (ECF subfamily)